MSGGAKWTVQPVAAPNGDRFELLSPEGASVETGPCAKALAAEAFERGADEVRHGYDLGRDDCPAHTLKRVKP